MGFMKDYYSTVDVARLCNVTRSSIINWTKKGILKSRRTPGGHRRIYKDDLFDFINTYGIGIDSIKDEKFIKEAGVVRCWEFHGFLKGASTHNCKRCVVFLSDTKKCYTLRKNIGHKKIFCKTTCLNCEYYEKVRDKVR